MGAGCHLGLVHLGRDVLVGSGVHIPSGPDTHGIAEHFPAPSANSQGWSDLVTIGQGAWIGNAAVILADVGQGAVVGAGSVVTRPVAPPGPLRPGCQPRS